jgi:hypothetical protein
MTLNEKRSVVGLEPLPNGDKIYNGEQI